MASETFSSLDVGLIIAGGLVESLGMMVCIYATSIGIGGIAFALTNTCCIYVTLFNFFAMGQGITLAQVSGIILTLAGASVVAAQEQIH